MGLCGTMVGEPVFGSALLSCGASGSIPRSWADSQSDPALISVDLPSEHQVSS